MNQLSRKLRSLERNVLNFTPKDTDCMKNLRKRAAAKFQNPNLLTKSFKSYRHWGGSMLA